MTVIPRSQCPRGGLESTYSSQGSMLRLSPTAAVLPAKLVFQLLAPQADQRCPGMIVTPPSDESPGGELRFRSSWYAFKTCIPMIEDNSGDCGAAAAMRLM